MMIQKTIAILLSLIIPFGGMLMITSCEEKNENITLSLVTTPMSENDYISKIPYVVENCDSCFFTPTTQLSPALAKTAIVLSSSAYDRQITKENLKSLGFTNIRSFNYDIDYDENAVGITFGVKYIKNTPVIAIVMRGTLAKEWHSNFDIGEDAKDTLVHKGFYTASEISMELLNEYKTEENIDNADCRYFVTGHSRGGAVANLLAKELIDSSSPDFVYAYTFASPNTTLDENVHNSEYSGIYNFVNCEDFIAFVPLESWGFQKYGTTKYLLTSSDDENYSEKLELVKEKYETYRKRELKTYNGTEKLQKFLNSAHKLAPTVDDYYNKKYEILGDEMSVYEFMDTIAQLINNENILNNALMILNCDGTAFEDIKNFMMLGMDSDTALIPDYDNSLISYTHSAESYLCYLEVFLSDI